jgi:hypothetical protein
LLIRSRRDRSCLVEKILVVGEATRCSRGNRPTRLFRGRGAAVAASLPCASLTGRGRRCRAGHAVLARARHEHRGRQHACNSSDHGSARVSSKPGGRLGVGRAARLPPPRAGANRVAAAALCRMRAVAARCRMRAAAALRLMQVLARTLLPTAAPSAAGATAACRPPRSCSRRAVAKGCVAIATTACRRQPLAAPERPRRVSSRHCAPA